MKKTMYFVLFVFFCSSIFNAGCSTVATTTASAASVLEAESMKIWSRPLEFGFTIIGVGEATAENAGDKIVDTAPAFFLGGTVPENKMSPLAKLAAYNAIRKFDADGMYVTMIKETSKGGSSEAWVRGVMLKLKHYGPVEEIRADKGRCCGCDSSAQ